VLVLSFWIQCCVRVDDKRLDSSGRHNQGLQYLRREIIKAVLQLLEPLGEHVLDSPTGLCIVCLRCCLQTAAFRRSIQTIRREHTFLHISLWHPLYQHVSSAQKAILRYCFACGPLAQARPRGTRHKAKSRWQCR
jgi:hypothetical protein